MHVPYKCDAAQDGSNKEIIMQTQMYELFVFGWFPPWCCLFPASFSESVQFWAAELQNPQKIQIDGSALFSSSSQGAQDSKN